MLGFLDKVSDAFLQSLLAGSQVHSPLLFIVSVVKLSTESCKTLVILTERNSLSDGQTESKLSLQQGFCMLSLIVVFHMAAFAEVITLPQ